MIGGDLRRTWWCGQVELWSAFWLSAAQRWVSGSGFRGIGGALACVLALCSPAPAWPGVERARHDLRVGRGAYSGGLVEEDHLSAPVPSSCLPSALCALWLGLVASGGAVARRRGVVGIMGGRG